MNDLVWIAVPNRLLDPADLPPQDEPGQADHRFGTPAVVRVAVVPRLGPGTLDDYGMRDWPHRLQHELTFQGYVKTAEGTRQMRTRPVLFKPVANRDVWAAVFRDGADQLFAGSPRRQEEPEVTRQYRDAQKISTTYREASRILAQPGRGNGEMRRNLSEWAGGGEPAERREPFPLTEDLDFRRTFGLLREHPEVLRDLGLVFELLVEGDELAEIDGPERYLSIRSEAPGLSVTSPWTRYDIDDHGFWPGADPERSDGVRRGLVHLTGVDRVDRVGEDDPPPWAIATFDVDGGVTGLRAAAKLLDAAEDQQTPLPALRSAGLMLIRHDRKREFEDRLRAAAVRTGNRARQRNDEDDLSADDLVLGYRLDVISRDDPHWRSLCAREARYSVTDAAGDPIPVGVGRDRREEGHTKHLAAVRGEDGVVRSDEIVVRWDGWSLAVPPPRLGYQARDPFEQAPARAAPYRLNWHFKVPPGTLPRLRFGRRYRLRVRVADIAGGGPDLHAMDPDEGASNEIAYRRVEPVLPPRLHVESSQLPGAAVDRLVIRSDRDMAAEQFTAAEPRYAARDTCTLYPPTAPFSLVEQHGVLDSMTDQQSWARAAQALAVAPDDPPALSLPDPAASGVAAYVAPAPGGLDQPLWRPASWGKWPSERPKTVVVGEAPRGGSPISLRWEPGGQLQVYLAQGEEADVELSSTIPYGYLDQFLVREWIDGDDPSGDRQPPEEADLTADDAYGGRHPLLSPAVTVRVVHAVRRPLVDPAWQDEVAVSRAEGDTAALLTASFAEDGIDTDSTGRIEVAATWEDWSDEGPTQMTVDLVYERDVARGAPPQLRFRHEFGDTKHRDVTYHLKGISRFRQYFEADEPAKAFEAVAVEDPEPVVVRSCAKPPDLEVLAVVPGFRWSTETTADRIVRRRAGNRLVVELARPWYETGAGEKLAVLAAIEPPTKEHMHLVTEVAGDPVYDSPRINERFPGADWFETEATSLTLPEEQLTVSVVPHPVTRVGDRWRAEVGMTLPHGVASYRPFIRLAVARYQPDSIEKLELSSVVTTERVPLLPDREITVDRVGGELHVRVLGVNPTPANRVVVSVEESDGTHPVDLVAVDADDGFPAWRPLAGHTRTGEASGRPIAVPLPTGGVRPLRLRVREIEDLKPLGDLATPPEGLDAMPAELSQRTLLIDHIPIPADWLQEGSRP